MRNPFKKDPKEQYLLNVLNSMTNLDLLLTASYLDKLKAMKEANSKLSAEQIKEMFESYNSLTGSNQKGVGCSSCIAGVYKNILKTKKYILNEIAKRS